MIHNKTIVQSSTSSRNRNSCYYGINCKTMLKNEDHAKRYDHLC